MGSLMKVLPGDITLTFTIDQLQVFVDRLQRKEDTEPFRGVSTKRAAQITGLSARDLRRRHPQWHRIQQDHGRPEVRVSRKSTSPRSDLLFDENDCWKLRSENGGGPRPVDDENQDNRKQQRSTDSRTPPASEEYNGDPDDLEAITDKLLAELGR